MWPILLIAFVVGSTAFAPLDAVQDTSVATSSSPESLGPDPFFGAPESLATLVREAPSAVIAEITASGDLKTVEVMVPHATRRSVRGFATYTVRIRDVLYNRLEGKAAPLIVGSDIQLLLRVGRESAQRVVAKQIPVKPREECLLFLWHDQFGWSILTWPLQFRRSPTSPTEAELVVKSAEPNWFDASWLGASVPATMDGVVPKPNWARLVSEVRR